MADVQLEHGYLRIANRLVEAVLVADFTGLQVKILLALIRLTYGWKKKTVVLRQSDLANYINAKNSGAFRAGLRDLIAHGVVVVADGGRRGEFTTFAIEKDYSTWRKYEVGEGKLDWLYGRRPESNDEVLVQADFGFESNDQKGRSQRPIQAPPAPDSGGGTGSNSLNGETYDAGKIVKDKGKTGNKEQEIDEEDVTPPNRHLPPEVAALTAVGIRDVTRFGRYAQSVLEMVRDARSPYARAAVLAGYLIDITSEPLRAASYEQLGLAVQEYLANATEDFSSRYFDAFVERASKVLDRRDGRKALAVETKYVAAVSEERRVERSEERETEDFVAQFQASFPERFAALKDQAENAEPVVASTPFAQMTRDAVVFQRLVKLIRSDLLVETSR